MLVSQSSAPKTRIRVKNANNIWDKKWPIWPEPRARKRSLKRKKHPSIATWTMENPKSNSKNFFFSISCTRLAESTEGLNTSVAAGKVWLCKLFKYFQQKLGTRDWKGKSFQLKCKQDISNWPFSSRRSPLPHSCLSRNRETIVDSYHSQSVWQAIYCREYFVNIFVIVFSKRSISEYSPIVDGVLPFLYRSGCTVCSCPLITEQICVLICVSFGYLDRLGRLCIDYPYWILLCAL